jgi:hypothetical protein
MSRRKTPQQTITESTALTELLQPYEKYFEGSSLSSIVGMFNSFKRQIDNLALNEWAMQKQIAENKALKEKLAEITAIKQVADLFENEGPREKTPSSIKKIVFEGKNKGEKITFRGNGIWLIAAMFRALLGYESNPKPTVKSLFDLSPELATAWGGGYRFYLSDQYKHQEIVKRYTQQDRDAILLEIKKNLSYEIHSFLKFASSISTPPKISEEELRLIGNFFMWAGLCAADEFVINEDYAKIRFWIKRAFIHLIPTKKG